MDSSSIMEGNKVAEKYSGLDQSLKFIQSLVSHRTQRPSEIQEVQQNNKLGAANEFEQNRLANDEDMENEDYENDEDVKMEAEDHPESIHNKSIASESLSTNEAMNVEDRLYMMDNIYKQRRKEKLQAAEEERKFRESQTKPVINK